MGILKLIFSYLELPVSVTTSEPVTFFNIVSPGDWAKFTENISQRHNEYVSLGILFGLKYVLHEWRVFERQPLVIYLRKFKSISM